MKPAAPRSQPKSPAKSLADQAYEALETQLVTLQLKPGAILTEGELIERLGLGRTPIREALQRLALQGMLTIQPRKGIQVTPILLGDHLALLEARRELERLVASRAARRASPEQRESLKAIAKAILQAAKKADLKGYLELDHACDELLEEASRNPYAMQALNPMRAQCRRFWFAHKHHGDLPRFARLHAEVMETVAAGRDVDAAHASDQLLDELEAFSKRALSLS